MLDIETVSGTARNDRESEERDVGARGEETSRRRFPEIVIIDKNRVTET